jgi:hypothetical protein
MIGERSGRLDSSRVSPWHSGLVAGALGYVAETAVLVATILDSPSSTAAIDFLFVPFCAVVPGLFGFALGCSPADRLIPKARLRSREQPLFSRFVSKPE